MCSRFWWGNLRERDYWGDQDVDGRIILRWIFREWEGHKMCTRIWWGNLRERDHWGDQDVDGRIILRTILRK